MYSGILSGNLSGIYSDILPDILSVILSGIYSDILTGIFSGSHSGIPSGSYSDILSGILTGILSHILSRILSGMNSGRSPFHSLLSSIWRSGLGPINTPRYNPRVQECPQHPDGQRSHSKARRGRGEAVAPSRKPGMGEKTESTYPETASVSSQGTVRGSVIFSP